MSSIVIFDGIKLVPCSLDDTGGHVRASADRARVPQMKHIGGTSVGVGEDSLFSCFHEDFGNAPGKTCGYPNPLIPNLDGPMIITFERADVLLTFDTVDEAIKEMKRAFVGEDITDKGPYMMQNIYQLDWSGFAKAKVQDQDRRKHAMELFMEDVRNK